MGESFGDQLKKLKKKLLTTDFSNAQGVKSDEEVRESAEHELSEADRKRKARLVREKATGRR